MKKEYDKTQVYDAKQNELQKIYIKYNNPELYEKIQNSDRNQIQKGVLFATCVLTNQERRKCKKFIKKLLKYI